MSPEAQKPSEFNNILSVTAIIGGLYLLSQAAFSLRTKRIIYERDVTCVNCNGTSYLSAAHIDHNKKNPRYDDASNGRLLCGPCHLQEHINREGRNGITVSQNRWGMARLLDRMRGKHAEDID
jgi:hypothetical protein